MSERESLFHRAFGRREAVACDDIEVVRQALIDSGSPMSGPHDGGIHPVAQEALDALGRIERSLQCRA